MNAALHDAASINDKDKDLLFENDCNDCVLSIIMKREKERDIRRENKN